MKRTRLRNLLLSALLVLLLVTGLVVLPVVRQLRQEAKNRALITAVKKNDERAVTRLLDEGADANAKDLPTETRPFWRVMWDRVRGRSKKVENSAPSALLAALYFEPPPHRSPHKRVWYPVENVPLIRALLDHGADPSAVDNFGWSPLCFALRSRKADTAVLLIQHGAKFNLVRHNTPWPLFMALIYLSKHEIGAPGSRNFRALASFFVL